jgi:hypothetical protein
METIDVNGKFNAAGKPVLDAKQIFSSLGSTDLGDVATIGTTLSGRFVSTPKLNQFFAHLQSGDTIILQYPIYLSYFVVKKMLKYLKVNDIRVIFFIHDFNSLRISADGGVRGVGHTRDQQASIRKEIDLLNFSNQICVPTNAMRDFILNHGYKGSAYVFGMYDYLADPKKLAHKTSDYHNIIFAGNLNKAPFINGLVSYKDASFQIFGQKPLYALNPDLNYQGVYPADKLISNFGSGFGLVWDGDSTDRVSGVLGEYMRFNSPYKASMYLAAGLPIIVWEKAAIADLVFEHNLGITATSISDAVDQITAISESQYAALVASVKKFSSQICQGGMIKQVFQQLNCSKKIKGANHK